MSGKGSCVASVSNALSANRGLTPLICRTELGRLEASPCHCRRLVCETGAVPMLPTTSDNVSRLAEVLPSSIASLPPQSNSLRLPSPPPPPQSRASARGSRPESTVSSAFERSIHATTNCAISSETGTLVCSRRHGSDHPRCLNKPRTSRVLSLVPLDTLIQDFPGWYGGVRATCLPRASRSGARLPNRLCERSEIHSFISTCQSLTHSRTRTDGNQRRG